jgi:hypothetical protein
MVSQIIEFTKKEYNILNIIRALGNDDKLPQKVKDEINKPPPQITGPLQYVINF